MKMRTFFATALAMLTLASCSKNERDGGSPDLPSTISKAYMSLSVQFPQGTKATASDAGPGTEAGTQEESTVSSVWVIAFDDALNKVDAKEVTGNVTVGGQGTLMPFTISEKTTQVFVAINTPTALENQIKGANTYDEMNKAISTLTAADLTQANQFLMVSSGSMTGDVNAKVDDKGLSKVELTIAASDSDGDRQQAIEEAKGKAVAVSVDRVVSKVKVIKNAAGVTVADNATADITGWVLNTTNKSFFPYAPRVEYPATGNAVYRQDPNYENLPLTPGSVDLTDACGAFNWIHNSASALAGGATVTWKGLAEMDYCLENTMEAGEAQNYNNTTKVVLKATYTPQNKDAEGWFYFNNSFMDLSDVQEHYNTVSGDKQKLADLLVALGLQSKTWDSALANAVTLDDLNGVEDVAYKVAKFSHANDMDMQYYPNSECYYAVNIKHDNQQQEGMLGRWGVVRNNSYTLQIDNINGAGTSYIPDPTDPDVGPGNPDPSDPKPNDGESKAYIAVTITVNDWTTWTQGVDL
ncbi:MULTISPECIES: Mfa1 family fimbria major subunit [Alistipes]|uniref:Mfa1 family fimbria major subunit n=1 Tax=Alistipes TaxID=239759 RepID=UPI002356B69A|nr:Mfa1 family fimbria major subunit [Alistipes ihumii]